MLNFWLGPCTAEVHERSGDLDGGSFSHETTTSGCSTLGRKRGKTVRKIARCLQTKIITIITMIIVIIVIKIIIILIISMAYLSLLIGG